MKWLRNTQTLQYARRLPLWLGAVGGGSGRGPWGYRGGGRKAIWSQMCMGVSPLTTHSAEAAVDEAVRVFVCSWVTPFTSRFLLMKLCMIPNRCIFNVSPSNGPCWFSDTDLKYPHHTDTKCNALRCTTTKHPQTCWARPFIASSFDCGAVVSKLSGHTDSI